jgi:hypothetical protein
MHSYPARHSAAVVQAAKQPQAPEVKQAHVLPVGQVIVAQSPGLVHSPMQVPPGQPQPTSSRQAPSAQSVFSAHVWPGVPVPPPHTAVPRQSRSAQSIVVSPSLSSVSSQSDSMHAGSAEQSITSWQSKRPSRSLSRSSSQTSEQAGVPTH